MSIFSRLFNKGQEPESKPEEASTNAPATPATPPSKPEPAAPAEAPRQEQAPTRPASSEVQGEEDDEGDAPTMEHERPDLVEQTVPPPNAAAPAAPAKPALEQPPTAREMRPTASRPPAGPPRPKTSPRPETKTTRSGPPPPLPKKSNAPPRPAAQAAEAAPAPAKKAPAARDVPPPPRMPSVHDPGSDVTDVRALFADLAANYMMPVRDFMFEVRAGSARADWLHTYDAAVKSLKQAAEGLDLKDLARELGTFREMLAKAANATGHVVTGGAREDLLRVYENLVAIMPNAFALDAEGPRRETIILNALLLQVPGVERTTLDGLAAAGLSTLERFLIAAPEEVAAVAGIPVEVAKAMLDEVRGRRADIARGSISSLPPPPAPVGPGAPPMPGVKGHPFASSSDSVDADSSGIDVLVDVPEASFGSTDAHPAAPEKADTPVATPAVGLVSSDVEATPANLAAPEVVAAKAPAPRPPSTPPAPTLPLAEAKELAALVGTLREVHEKFVALADKWTDAATSERRTLRKERTRVADEIASVLARAGEKRAVEELEKLPFDRKLAYVTRYLKS